MQGFTEDILFVVYRQLINGQSAHLLLQEWTNLLGELMQVDLTQGKVCLILNFNVLHILNLLRQRTQSMDFSKDTEVFFPGMLFYIG
jgi:hypothetical protein